MLGARHSDNDRRPRMIVPSLPNVSFDVRTTALCNAVPQESCLRALDLSHEGYEGTRVPRNVVEVPVWG